jgi:hypothetical protein
VYLSAILLIGWGTLVLSTLVSERDFHYSFLRAIVPVVLEIAIGCGLLFHRRWAWILGVTTAVLFIAEGMRWVVFFRGEYVVIDLLVRYIVPAIVILVSLLPGGARRAFLGERRADFV